MRPSTIGVLPVCDAHCVVGIPGEHDLRARAAAEGCDPKVTSVREAMTPELLARYEDHESAEAVRLMQERQHRQAAVLRRNQRLVSIISRRAMAAPGREEALAGSAIC
jgi:CBS domain-containing protein